MLDAIAASNPVWKRYLQDNTTDIRFEWPVCFARRSAGIMARFQPLVKCLTEGMHFIVGREGLHISHLKSLVNSKIIESVQILPELPLEP
ncbi:MAG: hypothetical protein ABL925_19090 [Methylococcales bacterium]